jgi:hypothetical protein
MGAYRTDEWDNEKRGSDIQSGRQFDCPAFPQTLEDLELEFKREAMELGRIRDKEEDEENYRHREVRIIHRAGVHVQSDNWCYRTYTTHVGYFGKYRVFFFFNLLFLLNVLASFCTHPKILGTCWRKNDFSFNYMLLHNNICV